MLVGDGDNQQIATFHRVNHAIGKTIQATSPRLLREWVPRLRKLGDEFECLEGFNQKCFTQTGCLIGLPLDRLVQFMLRRLQQQNIHAAP